MATNESNNETLTWTSRKAWGCEGRVHDATIVIGGDTYKFTVDQVRKGRWTARGWNSGVVFLYRDGEDFPTLKSMKDEVARVVGELLIKVGKA